MSLGKSKAVALSAGIGVFLMAGLIAFLLYEQFSGPGSSVRQVRVTAAAGGKDPSLPDLNDPKWQADFEKVYSLSPGQVLKHISPPFISARQAFYLKRFGAGQYNSIPRGPDTMILGAGSAPGLPQLRGATFGGGGAGYVIESMLGIHSWQMDASAVRQLVRPITGDWLFRQNADSAQLRAALLEELSRATNSTLTLEQKPAQREAIIVSGTLSLHPLTTQPAGARRPVVLLYRGTPGKPQEWFQMGPDLINMLASICQREVIVEGAARPVNFDIRVDRNVFGLRAPAGTPEEAKQTDELLANLARQTSLIFTREKRELPTWVLTSTPASSAAR
jgi:hypothetical protein